jgi:hypothetical protein
MSALQIGLLKSCVLLSCLLLELLLIAMLGAPSQIIQAWCEVCQDEKEQCPGSCQGCRCRWNTMQWLRKQLHSIQLEGETSGGCGSTSPPQFSKSAVQSKFASFKSVLLFFYCFKNSRSSFQLRQVSCKVDSIVQKCYLALRAFSRKAF